MKTELQPGSNGAEGTDWPWGSPAALLEQAVLNPSYIRFFCIRSSPFDDMGGACNNNPELHHHTTFAIRFDPFWF